MKAKPMPARKKSRTSRRSNSRGGARKSHRRHGNAWLTQDDDLLPYSVHNIDREGNVWGSPASERAPAAIRHIRQTVIGAWLPGNVYWAEDGATGAFLYGLDAKGQPMTARPRMPEPKKPRTRGGKKLHRVGF